MKRISSGLFIFNLLNLLSIGNADDYMKREFSLVKPYQGNIIVIHCLISITY